MDLDLWDCFGRKKLQSYNQRNTVTIDQCVDRLPGASAEEQLVAVASVIYLRSGKSPAKLEVTSLPD